MKFLSYAQNFEDVILNRAFAGQDQGFYLDVGASHPIGHSVTKTFYDRGWSGMNIEPGAAAFELIVADRPRDLNLNVGISQAPGQQTFYEAVDSIGISTFNPRWLARWQARGIGNFVAKSVPMMTLAQVCEQYVDRPIDFLKIDVEGYEPEVLAGADLSRWRPRVLLIEGIRGDYEAGLLDCGYHHAAFDGVNHYFVPEEERALIPLLAAPVSPVVDQFELHETVLERTGHQNALERLAEAEAIRDELDANLESALARLAELTRRHEMLQAQLAPMVEVKGAFPKANGVFAHPAHRIRMMSSHFRNGIRSFGSRLD